MRTTGRGEDYLRENPRQFRGVKQKMTPKERKTANLYARAQAQAGHIPLETLLTGYGDEGEVGLPALADVQAHRGEMRAYREHAKREGSYRKMRKPDLDKQSEWLQLTEYYAPAIYPSQLREFKQYNQKYAEQEEASAAKKGMGAKNRAFIKSKLNRR